MNVIYEVNLQVEPALVDEFSVWLEQHVSEMLALSGFLAAEITREEQDGEPAPAFSVRYRLESRAALEDYFTHQAERMRNHGLQRFGQRFSASRRILFEIGQ